MIEQFAGQTFDHYQLIEPLGRGDMGVVYKALNIKLEREIALKIIDASLTERPDFQERFTQFARASAGLTHPALVGVTDFGQVDTWFYLVMDLIPGQNLLRLLSTLRKSKRWLPLPEAVQMVRQICQTLAFAHQHGLWLWTGHPRNVLLHPTPLEIELGPNLPYQPRVTDVGIARLHDEGNEPAKATDRLSLAFLSPEQVLNQPLEPRSDVYAVGALLYLLATGELPLKAKSLAEAKEFHLQRRPLLPKAVRPDLPENLQTIIMRALAHNPADRFDSMAVLVTALTDFFQGEPEPEANEPRSAETHEPKTSPNLPLVTDQLVIRTPEGGLQVVQLQQSRLTFGRAPDNDVVLDHPDMSRHHIRFEVSRTGYHLTDLNSTNGAYLDDQLLAPGVAAPWRPGQILYVADFQLTIEPQQPFLADQPRQPQPAATRYTPALERVGLLMPDNHLTVEPGQRVTTTIIVQNQGRESDLIKIGVEGLPTIWVLAPGPLKLSPGKKQEVKLSLQPPRVSESQAGRYPLLVRATSQEDPSQFATVEGTLTVTTYEQFNSEFQPYQVEAGAPAQLVVANQGNTTATFDIRWLEKEARLRFEPSQPQLTIPAGQHDALEFQVTPARRRWLGGRNISPFSAQVSTAAGGAQTPAGAVVSRSLIPTWLLLSRYYSDSWPLASF